MRFDIFSLFPEIVDSYANESILKRAIENGLVSVKSHNIRDWATDKHHTTDDTPYGGGAGMVLKIEPIYNAVRDNSNFDTEVTLQGLRHSSKQRIIVLSAKGEIFTQKKAVELTRYEQVMLICGRYEGIDERVAEYIADEELSIGEYVLTGGELPALVVMDTVVRLKKGVLGNEESLARESFVESEKVEHPHYTRPEVFSPRQGIDWKVPDVLLSGHHKEIEDFRSIDK